MYKLQYWFLNSWVVEYPIPVSQEDLAIQATFKFHADGYGYTTAGCLEACHEAPFFKKLEIALSWRFAMSKLEIIIQRKKKSGQ